MTKQRWIKVSISYREGRLDQWDAPTLGDTSMVQLVEPVTGKAAETRLLEMHLDELAAVVRLATSELIQRTDRIAPPDSPESELFQPVTA